MFVKREKRGRGSQTTYEDSYEHIWRWDHSEVGGWIELIWTEDPVCLSVIEGQTIVSHETGREGMY